MEFSDEDISKLMEEVSKSKEINLIDIPCIDLYMDQVTTLFEDKLSHLKRDDDEAILTKTMINNYAKAKILTPIKNKKYNRQQIIMLILLYNMKQIMSLDDIKSIFLPVIEVLNSNTCPQDFMEDLYSKFLNIKLKHRTDFKDQMQRNIDSINSLLLENDGEADDLSNLILTILTLIDSANLQRRMAEKLIDSFLKKKEQ